MIRKTILATVALCLLSISPSQAQTPLRVPKEEPVRSRNLEAELAAAYLILGQAVDRLHRCSRELSEMQADQLVMDTEGGRLVVKQISDRCQKEQDGVGATLRVVRNAEAALKQ